MSTSLRDLKAYGDYDAAAAEENVSRLEADLRAARDAQDGSAQLEAELKGQPEQPHPARVNIFEDPNKKKSNNSLYLMIGGYIVLYYLFSGTQSQAR